MNQPTTQKSGKPLSAAEADELRLTSAEQTTRTLVMLAALLAYLGGVVILIAAAGDVARSQLAVTLWMLGGIWQVAAHVIRLRGTLRK